MADFPSDYSTTAPPSAPISPAWEDESRPIFDRWKDTVVGVFTAPTAFFDAMRQEAGLGAPLVFAIIGGWIGAAAMMVWNFIGSALHIPMIRGGNFFGTICAVVLAPVVVAVLVFIVAGVLHLCLMLVGGAKRPFETTFRVVAYVLGSTMLVGVVPFCGGYIGGIWAIVLYVIGLTRAHQTTTGKALVAVLIPVAAGCLCVIAFWVAAAGVILAALHGVR